jgi:hypothetical protein
MHVGNVCHLVDIGGHQRQRLVSATALQGKDRGNRGRIIWIGGKPVQRVGWKRDDASRSDRVDRATELRLEVLSQVNTDAVHVTDDRRLLQR